MPHFSRGVAQVSSAAPACECALCLGNVTLHRLGKRFQQRLTVYISAVERLWCPAARDYNECAKTVMETPSVTRGHRRKITGNPFVLKEFALKPAAGTHCPLEVCTRSVTKVDVAGHTQFSANMAYLNSSSHTT